MTRFSKLLILPLALGLAACEAPTVDTNDTVPARQATDQNAHAEIEDLNDRWAQYHSAGEFEQLAALYASNAVVVTPEGRIEGRSEIENDFRDRFREGQQSDITLDRIEVAESGELGYMLGRWSSDDGYAGSFLSAVERQNDGWVIAVDAFNVEESPEEEPEQ